MNNTLASTQLATTNSNNEHIVANFSKQAFSYDQAAYVQRLAAQRLAQLIVKTSPAPISGSILEVGCGTGLLSKYLLNQFPNQKIYLLDPAANMLSLCEKNLSHASSIREQQTPPNTHFVENTIENFLIDLKFTSVKHAIIASSFAFQWLIDLSSVINQLIERLEVGGQLFFSYPIAGSFPEWQASCRNLDLPFTANQSPGFSKLNSLVNSKKATIYCEEYLCQLTFADSLQFFKEMKMLGAHSTYSMTPGDNLSPSNQLTVSELRRLTKDWNQQFPNGPITCTYKIIEGIITSHG